MRLVNVVLIGVLSLAVSACGQRRVYWMPAGVGVTENTTKAQDWINQQVGCAAVEMNLIEAWVEVVGWDLCYAGLHKGADHTIFVPSDLECENDDTAVYIIAHELIHASGHGWHDRVGEGGIMQSYGGDGTFEILEDDKQMLRGYCD